jgi:hypothetical protein
MDTQGLKRFLLRTKTLAEIKIISAKAHSAVEAGEDQIAITSSSFDGGSGSGVVTRSAKVLADVCEQIIADAEGDAAPRQAFVPASFARS